MLAIDTIKTVSDTHSQLCTAVDGGAAEDHVCIPYLRLHPSLRFRPVGSQI